MNTTIYKDTTEFVSGWQKKEFSTVFFPPIEIGGYNMVHPYGITYCRGNLYGCPMYSENPSVLRTAPLEGEQ